MEYFFEDYIKLLSEYRIKEVIQLMMNDRRIDNTGLYTPYENIRLVLKYFGDGVDDPQSDDLLYRIRKNVLEVLRQSYLNHIEGQPNHPLNLSHSHLLEVIPNISNYDDELNKILLRFTSGAIENNSSQYFSDLQSVFDLTLLTRKFSDDNIELFKKLFIGSVIDDPMLVRAILAALYLQALIFPSIQTLSLLINASLPDTIDSARGAALPSLVMVIAKHYKLINDFYNREMISMPLPQSEDMLCAITSIYSVYKTEDDNRFFTEQVAPKLRDTMMSLGGVGNMQEMMQKLEAEGRTEELIEAESLLREVTKRSKEEKDMGYHAVKNILERIAYSYNDSYQWFRLFLPETNPIIGSDKEKYLRLMPLFTNTDVICSADAYALMNYVSLPPQIDDMLNQIPEEASKWPERNLKYYIRDFVYCAYRFHQLSISASEIYNIFENKPLLTAHKPISDVVTNDGLKELGTLLVRLQEYSLSKQTYQQLYDRIEDKKDAEVLRGLALGANHEGDYDQSIHYLEEVLAIEGDSASILMKLGELYLKINNREKSLDYYKRADALLPDSIAATKHLARLALNLEQYDISVNAYYKIDYLAGDDIDSDDIINLSRALILSGKPKDALERLETIASEKRDAGYFSTKVIALIKLDRDALFKQAPKVMQEWASLGEKALYDYDLFKNQVYMFFEPEEISILKIAMLFESGFNNQDTE